jgi:hypothetical protein
MEKEIQTKWVAAPLAARCLTGFIDHSFYNNLPQEKGIRQIQHKGPAKSPVLTVTMEKDYDCFTRLLEGGSEDERT